MEERPFEGRVNVRKTSRALASVVAFAVGAARPFTGAEARSEVAVNAALEAPLFHGGLRETVFQIAGAGWSILRG